MTLDGILQAIESTRIAAAVRGEYSGSEWLFPIVEVIHVLSIAAVFGSIVMVDLRLLGVASRDSAVSKLSQEVLPYTWAAFVCAAISGSLMFISKAHTYFYNLHFQLKFLFMVVAGINMLAFHFGVYRRVVNWDLARVPPRAARIAGALSVALWVAIICMGRWIGFSTN